MAATSPGMVCTRAEQSRIGPPAPSWTSSCPNTWPLGMQQRRHFVLHACIPAKKVHGCSLFEMACQTANKLKQAFQGFMAV